MSTAALLARALGGTADTPTDAVGERILDAALELAAASGLRNITMDDVARRAGVGRMTVYRRFGDREGLLQALVGRESQRFLAELDRAAPVDAPIDDQVAAGFVASVRLAREHPLLNRLARIEPGSVVRALRGDGSGLFALCRTYLEARLRSAQDAGVVGEVPVEEAAELLVRLALSFVLVEDTALPLDDDEAMHALARRQLAPILRTRAT